jgi:hypothetical protein
VFRIADVGSGARMEVINLEYLNLKPATWSKFRFSAPIREWTGRERNVSNFYKFKINKK